MDDVNLPGGNGASRGNRLLSQFTGVDGCRLQDRVDVGGWVAKDAQSGGYTSAFAGVKPTQAKLFMTDDPAEIRSMVTLVIDVYNAAGQGVYQRTPFIGSDMQGD